MIKFAIFIMITVPIIGICLAIISVKISWSLHLNNLVGEFDDISKDEIISIQHRLNYYTGSSLVCDGTVTKDMLRLMVSFEMKNDTKLIEEAFPDKCYEYMINKIFSR